ncbi:MAG: GNAT family N-acetyltransferase [Chloroflexi bacterium]|nr:GNAT family N-acetyltransferase [Chloroflexota bacterium]
MPDSMIRTQITALLTSQPSDALAAYFALEHDARRTRLTVRTDARGRAVAFVAVCQTGIDLFRPLVVMRGDDTVALHTALHEALSPGRQYLFSAPVTLRTDIDQVANLYSETINKIYTLARPDFKPIVNILVQTNRSPEGLLRVGIRARDESWAAEAGTTWISSRYAEVYVRVVEAARNRGLGKSVVSALSAQLLDMNRIPLYSVAEDNIPSQRLALRLGYRDTGGWELSGAMSLR